jgi:UPF0755 protein
VRTKFAVRRLLVVAVLLLSLLAIAVLNRSAIRNAFDNFTGVDFAGSGHGSVILQIEPGDDGAEVATELVDLGVVKTYRKIYQLIIEREYVFYPGTYNLKLEMSSTAALDALSDASNRVSNRVTIREGLRINQVLKALSSATSTAYADLQNAAQNLEAIGVPASEVSAEGWLFPATYEFDPGISATEMLKTMVRRTIVELDKFGVAKADRHRVLTLAALIQKEARLEPDFYKVSRVFLNRIEKGMLLQSDATVSYGVGGSTVSTSAADRADRNGYNTYVFAGLPIGPIGAPGSVAIDAALHPAKGDWIFFCTVNLETGETMFSTTYSEHQAAVRIWQAWMRENPGYE